MYKRFLDLVLDPQPQMIEGVASEAEYFLSFQTLLLPGDPVVFRLALYFSTNFNEKLTTDNAWLMHIHELHAKVVFESTHWHQLALNCMHVAEPF